MWNGIKETYQWKEPMGCYPESAKPRSQFPEREGKEREREERETIKARELGVLIEIS